ncbi:hypothetical protein H0H92_002357 [Tricholoma furcatifolium]|nr:hypothetical protein H0H92_002357 [Tricholoma furcatifolium]
MMISFVKPHENRMDPKIEGPVGSTSNHRAEEHEYIQEQIEVHQSDQTISRYYKRRLNALSNTCRIPVEILASIFSRVVDSTPEDDPRVEWIPQVSHVCSHWREVSLSTPRLWSTLHLDSPTRSLEMFRRSKGIPLTVVLYGQMFKGAYDVLHQVVASHLHHIKALTLGTEDDMEYIHIAEPRDRQINDNEFRELLQLLGQNNGPLKLEQLILTTDPVGEFYRRGLPFLAIIQDDIITASSSLKHLELKGFGMNCGPLHTFHRLQSFHLSFIPEEFLPSLAQLLRFLSQMPVLSALHIDELSADEEVFSSHEDMPVHMRCLQDIFICCQSAPILDSFFDLVKFPKDAVSLVTDVSMAREDIEELLNEPGFISFPRNISRKMDAATDGLVSELRLSMFYIECWKSKGRPNASSFPEEFPVIKIKWANTTTVGALIVCFLEGLRLDQLVSFELETKDRMDDSCRDLLTLFGNLPSITQFRIVGNYPSYAIESLCRGIHADPRPASFPALTTLVIVKWNFKDPLQAPWPRGTMPIDALLYCVNLRALANVPIKLLHMENCSGYGEKDTADLRNLVDEVVLNDEDLDEEED